MKLNIETQIHPVLFWGAIIFILAALFFAHRACQTKFKDANVAVETVQTKMDSLENELSIMETVYSVDTAAWSKKVDSIEEEKNWYKAMYEVGLAQASEVNREAQLLAAQVKKEDGKNDTSCRDLSEKVILLNGQIANVNRSAKNVMDAAIVSQKIRDSIIAVERAARKRLSEIHDATVAQFNSAMRIAKSNQPRSAVYMGFSAQGNRVDVISAIGGGFTLVTKKGVLYGVDLMAQPWNNWQPIINLETKFKITFRR